MKSVLYVAMLLTCIGSSMLPSSAREEWRERHPRRAEVLRHDRFERREINADRGQLNGRYHRLMHEDRQISHQEQHWARQNGGYITRGEQRRLNREENRLQRQISHNYR